MAEEKKESRVKSAMGGKKKSSSKKSSSKKHKKIMHIMPTDNGRFSVQHEMPTGPGEEPVPSETHGINDLNELHQHLDEHYGPAPAEPTAGAAPAAAAPAAAPMG